MLFRSTRPDSFKGVGDWASIDQASTFYENKTAFNASLTGVNGVQVTTAGSFAIGSYLRCLVLP